MQNLLLITLTEIGDAIVNALSSWGIWYYVLFNFIGGVGVVVKIIGLQFRSRSTRIIFNTIQALCWMFYFMLNGNATAGVTGIIGFVQMMVFLQREKHKWADSYFWLFFFLAIKIGIAVWSLWDGISITEIFPILASPFTLIAYFVINAKVFRTLMFFSSLFWFINSVIGTFVVLTGNNLWMAFICDALSLSSIIIAIIRLDVKGNRKHKLAKETKE